MDVKNILLDSLLYENTSNIFSQLDESNSLEKIIPKVHSMKRAGECKYHVVNVYEHSLNALKEFEDIIGQEYFFSSHINEQAINYLNEYVGENMSKYHVLKLAIFLHDIGKYDCKVIDSSGRVHFKGHEIEGAKIAKDLSDRIGFNHKISNLLVKYVRHHMILLGLYKRNNMSEEILFDIFDKLDEDTIGIFILGYCDIVATRRLLNPNENMGVIKSYLEYALTNYIYRYN